MRDPGNLGGLYGFTVEFFTAFSGQHFVNLILDGVAYNLMKSGSDALVLRPFIAAYNALKRKNADRSSRVHVSRLRLSFQDSVVVIHGLRDDSILLNLESILKALAASYSHLILRTGKKPFSISISVVEDPAEDRLCRFREFLDFDETIEDIRDEHYLRMGKGIRLSSQNESVRRRKAPLIG